MASAVALYPGEGSKNRHFMLLFDQQKNMAKVSDGKEVALRRAAQKGRVYEVKELIESGVDANATDEVCGLLF